VAGSFPIPFMVGACDCCIAGWDRRARHANHLPDL